MRIRHFWKISRNYWEALGGKRADVFDVGKTKGGGDIKAERGIGYLTYDTLKGAERVGKDEQGKTVKGQSRLDQLIKWLGPDFDGVIAFDELHNMANAMSTRGERGVKQASAKALAGIELQQKLPNARVVYSSATGATEVMNLAYAERLGLWGRGTPFPSKQEFVSNIGAGGIAAMELVARDMKAMGHYLSRNLSYDDVKYDRVEHNLTPEQKDIYDGLAEGWQSVLRNIEAALRLTSADHTGQNRPNPRQRSNALSAFWGSHQRFFNQIITSIQMPSVIRAVEGDLKAGKQAVLQLVNTNEASQKRAIEKRGAQEGREGEDLYEDLDMTPRDQLMQMIEKSFPTQQTETYIDDNGNENTRGVTDSQGNPVHNPEAVAMKEALLDQVGSLRVPDGPLEILLNHFGPDKVAEVTGRGQRVVRVPDKTGTVKATLETRSGNANAAEASAFQNAKKPILVFSQAGGTGRSYHAENATPSADAQRSHYLVQAGWRADKAIQGFGRTHRTNQASAPIFHLVTTDLQGQKRFISSIARRLSQLGALTKGERRAGEQGMFGARDNLESTEARSALRDFWTDMQRNRVEGIAGSDFEKQTGLKLFNVDNQGNSSPTDPPEITRFLNRLLSLKFDMQNHVFGEFDRRLSDAVDRAAASGTLDVGTETLKGDRIRKEEQKTVYTDSQSGAETSYVRLGVDTKNHPVNFDDISAGKKLTAGRIPVFYALSKRSGKLYAVSEASSATDANGNITEQYRISDPTKWDYTPRSRLADDRYWERVDDQRQARDLWEKQVAAVPEYSTEDVHLITGAVMPIWDRLQGTPKVFRTQTDDGERMLGRVIENNVIDQTLRALGAETQGKVYEPQEVADRILQGDRATLANGWELKRSQVAGEPRIEVLGPNFTHRGELERDGVYTERIAYDTRFFVPTGKDAAETIGRIIEHRPITEMQTLGRAMKGLMQSETGAVPISPEFRAAATAAVRDVQMKVAPMAAGSMPAQAIAKDFANFDRAARDQRQKFDDGLRKFTPDQRRAMWEAANSASVAAQMGEDAERFLAPLPANQRKALADLDRYSRALWERAKDAGVVSGEGLPFYTTRAVLNIGEDGKATRLGRGAGEGPRGLEQIGINLTTKGVERRSYLTAEQTEAAARAKFGPEAQITRDIRTVPWALERLERAVAGSEMINKVKEISALAGRDLVVDDPRPGYFTVDHPAFKRYEPRFTTDPDTGKTVPVRDSSGNVVIDRKPIYVADEFEGPLKAVLRHRDGMLYAGAMRLKAGAVSLIMNSPLIHNLVEYGRALPLMPGKVALGKVYFEGNAFRRGVPYSGVVSHAAGKIAGRQTDLMINPDMRRAIDAGLVPIGHRGYLQDIAGIAEEPNMKPGRSMTAQLLGGLSDGFSPALADRIRSAVDTAGDFWHNTLLWDRVADLQAGLYKNMRERMLDKGMPEEAANRIAAHFANRYAGALPNEAMSEMARKIANVVLFSRSFKLGNLGVMKDVFTGLPQDVQAQIQRDLGTVGRAQAVSAARGKAIRTFVVDIAMFYALNAVLQTGLGMMMRDRSLSDEENDYLALLGRAMSRIEEHPLDALNPIATIASFFPQSENEPGKEDRALWTYTKDGTALYLRTPVGKIGEEFVGWTTKPLQMLRQGEGTLVRPLTNLFANDRGFGRKVYDPDAKGITGVAENLGRIGWEFLRSQIPEQQFDGLMHILSGTAREGEVVKTVAPFMGFTVSRGAPGGPEVGILYQAQREQRDRQMQAMPQVDELIRAGRKDEALQMMRGLGMPEGLIRYHARVIENPQKRLSGRALNQFLQYATPEQRDAMERAKGQGISP